MRMNSYIELEGTGSTSNFYTKRRYSTLRRNFSFEDQEDPVVRVGQLALYPEKYDARIDNHALRLTASEFRVLLLMARRVNNVVRRDELKQCLRSDADTSSDRALDNTVSRLRQKIISLNLRVTAIRGIGYELRDISSNIADDASDPSGSHPA